MSQTNPIARYRSAAQRLRALEAAGSKYYPTPWSNDEFDQSVIWTAANTRAVDVRGYGHLVGAGGIGLPDAEAEAVQDKVARCVRASRNLLLPWIEVGDALARTIEEDEASFRTYNLLAADHSEAHNRNLIALLALTVAIEREIGEREAFDKPE